MSIEAMELELRWGLRGSPRYSAHALIDRLVADLPGRQDANDSVQLARDSLSVWLQAATLTLEARRMSTSLGALLRWSRAVTSTIGPRWLRPQAMDLHFFTTGPLDPKTLQVLIEVGAPSLLLLLGRPRGRAIRLEMNGEVLHLTVPYLLHPSQAALVIPVVTGMLSALLRDGWRGILPRSLLRHPDLVVRETPQRMLLPLQRNNQPVIPEGRLTRLNALTVEGDPIRLYAQQSLTVLYLYAEPDILRLLPASLKTAVRDAIIGETELVRQSLPRRPATPSPPPSERRDAASGAGGRGSAVRVPMVARHLIMAVVQTGPDPVPSDLWAAQAMAKKFAVEVLLCPWYGLELAGRAVLVSGPVLRVSGNLVQPAIIPRQQAREVDMLFFTGASGGERAGELAGERRAFHQLVSTGVVSEGVTRYFLVDQLLVEASRRGVVTNAVARPRAWGPKHELELRLRAYRRATGQSLPRPETFIGARAQLPTILKSFARRGVDCIVKPAFGAWGAGAQALRPDTIWRRASNAQQYVVQQLVPRPLLVDGHKVDLRCHVVIDVGNRQRSAAIPPVLMRRAGAAYRRGSNDAEINNLTYQRRRGLRSTILPIEQMAGIPEHTRDAILSQVEDLTAQLIDAYFLWMDSVKVSHPDWIVPSRVLLWGLDVGISRTNGGVELLLLENNARPQLRRSVASCDRAMAAMLQSNYLPSAMRSRLDSVPRRPG